MRPKGSRERGATSTEYALLVGVLTLALVVGVGYFGSQLRDLFQRNSTEVSSIIVGGGSSG